VKLKLTLQRSGAKAVDLMATVDTGATVGDLAERVWRADPTLRGAGLAEARGRPTLFVRGTTDAAIDPAAKLAESGLRSGMTVGLTWAPEVYAAEHSETVAMVTATDPTGVTREHRVSTRAGVIGRDRDCAVVLADTLVSRQHVRFTIGSLPEIVDLGSANGVEVNGAPVTRAVVRPDDVVVLGDTRLTIRVVSTAGVGGEGASEGHIRSPRLDPRYPGEKFEAPEPPKRPDPPRFPIISVIAPLILGVGLYFVTRSVFALVFVALSPLMVIGYAVETMLSGRAAFKKAVKQFRADLDELAKDAETAAAEEGRWRRGEHPSVDDCVAAAQRRLPLLWTRRPADPGFCELRLGLGRQPSRTTIELPASRGLPRELVAEAKAVADKFSTVDSVPVLATPTEHGAIGLAGPRDVVLSVARALVAQVVSLHSPAELVLSAFATDEQSRDWEWLKWLPHTTSQHSPVMTRHLASTHEGAVSLVSALEELLEQRAGEGGTAGPVVVVLVEDAAPVERARVVELAERGWQHGIVVVWLAEDTTQLPAACRTFVALQPGAAGCGVGYVHSGESVVPLAVELLDAVTAEDLGRRLSPLVDVGARIDDDSDLPRAVSLLAVASSDRPVVAEPEYVLESWTQNRSILSGPYAPATPAKKAGTLRAVIGRTSLGPHALDLREDGPHALVGGTTGSGKSELLQAWILAMSAAHSPQRLTFMLIDYKGGAAFKDLARLPHTVGNFTDLDPHLVRRALVSLRAELREREKQFATYGVKDLVELEKLGISDPPPSLVIVVDEFAALAKELPEFVEGVVDVAQRGRSLGVHLILATQRPAGVITDNLRANTNLRLALRMADETDSADVLGTPQAAFFDPSIPGRAVSKTGPGRLVSFQTGYGGGWTSEAPPTPEIVLEELRFGAPVVWEVPESDQTPVNVGATDLQRMIGAIGLANNAARIPRPREPWLGELKPTYDLSALIASTSRSDESIVFGVRDVPEDQAQPPVAFHPDQQGNLAVYGTGRSGKSTLLRTLAIASVRGGACHVYGLDFGTRGLAMLEDLPHVGSIIAGTDSERVARLINWLGELVAERSDRYSAANAGSIADYRRLANAPQEPRILTLVDGVGTFRQNYDTIERAKLFDAFCQLAADGPAVGVHVMVTADRPGSVPPALASAIQTRVVLRMADPDDYGSLDVPSDVLKPLSPPGRGLLLGDEVQIAVLGGRSEPRLQAAAITDTADAMRRAGVAVAPPIRSLPERVSLAELPSSVEGQPVMGMVAASLAPAIFTPRGGFIISGPPQSGRTGAARAMAVALRRWDSAIELHLLTPSRRSELADLRVWKSVAAGPQEAKRQAEALASRLRTPGRSPTAVVIENVGEFASFTMDSETSEALAELVRVCLAEDVFVVAEGEASTLGGKLGPLEPLKRGRYGLALGPDPNDGDRIFTTPFPPRLSRADFPLGRGLLVHSGRTTTVGVGWVEEGS
jgi:S-DNA-T family DNA segregation ATPase FtsK/SpoIIIE